MTEPSNRTLQIDATIELGDYFRAYLDASKFRLMIGCLIVISFIAALSYFFVLIGEQRILLQLTPLFVGFPLVALAGQLLRAHAAYRKYLADLTDTEKQVSYIFREQADGFDIVNGKNFGHLSWDTVRQVIERSRYFRLVLNRYESLIVSKKFLRSQNDMLLMRHIIRSHVGDRARLLSN
jgi:hypothetical protein